MVTYFSLSFQALFREMQVVDLGVMFLDVSPERADHVSDQSDERGVVQTGPPLVEIADQDVAYVCAAQVVAVDEFAGRSLTFVAELFEAGVPGQHVNVAEEIPGREDAGRDAAFPVQVPVAEVFEIGSGQLVEVLSCAQDHLG
ncbi:hypothetical protein ACFVWZ_16150 [Streptomyces sp. NPDC058200]|uniref:hypothetical protein n=1 Tax=Streptomyces sp. NPDC058200 TaxID=3346378 RepID=UPI0036E3C05B